MVGGAGDDQRGPGLIDQDRVDLVDDREVVTPLDQLVGLQDHVVTEVVKPQFVVGSIGHVRRVGDPFVALALLRVDVAGRQPQEAVDPSHPFGVA